MVKRRRGRRRQEKPASATPVVEGYEELQVIGRGGSAVVYRAVQPAYDRHVAIKVFQVDISDRRAQRRFNRERSASGRLSHHPNVVTVLDSGLIEGRHPYLAMELFEDGSLADALETQGVFPIDRVLHVSIRVAGALESAHRLGVLHRDIKPQNLLLSRFGEPALADFGIAAILEAEPIMTAGLTPSHAAPELLEGADPTAQSDVYAFTSSIYTLLAGAPPFAGPEGEGILAQLLRVTTNEVPTVPRADMPASLHNLLRWGLAKRPEDRPASAMDLGMELQRIQAELGLPQTPLPVDSPSSGDWAATEKPTPTTGHGSAHAIDWPITEPPATPLPSAEPILRSTELGAEPPGPAPARVRLEGDDDLTVGVPPRLPTVVGRQAVVKRPPADGPERRWPKVAASAGAVIVGIAAVYGGSLYIGERDAGGSSPATESDGSVPLSDEELQALAPTGVGAVADAAGNGVVVRWTDQSAGRYNFVVRATMVDGSLGLPVTAEKGTSTAKLEVAPNMVDCITVSALVSFGEPSVLAPSDPFCL